METLTWKLISFIALILSFISIIIGIVSLDKVNYLSQCANEASPNKGNLPSSCASVTGPNGLYMVQPNDGVLPFYTYCDMTSSGGGWTLVGSVHENNIDGKCTVGDKWSSEQGITKNYHGAKNWENFNMFGRADAMTNADFKNPAYFSLKAKDVMIWHVPNNVAVTNISTKAYFKYHTTNGFLNNYGSTLQSMYSMHLPMKQAEGNLKKVFAVLNSSSMVTGIDNWHNYTYDSTRVPSQINDGGSDMYDAGNKVSYAINGVNFTQITYGKPYFLHGSEIEISSSKMYPFTALAWIGKKGSSKDFDISFKVESNFGADGKGNYSTYKSQVIRQGTTTARYRAYNVYGTSDPSVCEVYFYVADTAWNSVPPSNMNATMWSNSTNMAKNAVKFVGPMSQVYVGYFLMSKKKGKLVTEREIGLIMKRMMNRLYAVNYEVKNKQLSVPVTFIKGSQEQLKAGIPVSQQPFVQPGFIQFRAYNSAGSPNALCPGVKTISHEPASFCIGGINTAETAATACGDYAGWAGKSSDPINATHPSSTGRSLRDITSTILIFTR